MANKSVITIPIAIGLAVFSTLFTMTPLLIILRYVGTISPERVPDWLLVIQVITLVINGYAIKIGAFSPKKKSMTQL